MQNPDMAERTRARWESGCRGATETSLEHHPGEGVLGSAAAVREAGTEEVR